MDPNIRAMVKKGLFLRFKIRKLHAEFDGKTQAVRGALIAELEELHQWTLERVKAVQDERKKYRGYQFMARFSAHKSMLIRIEKLKRSVKVDTQRMRGTALKKLEEPFGLAVAFKEVQTLL